MTAPSGDPAVAAALGEAHRSDWAGVVAAAARITRDLDDAEECAQDAFAEAVGAWTRGGVPARPGAWLTTVARRRAIDLVRRRERLRERLPLLVGDVAPEPPDPLVPGDGTIPDDRLRLVFTCCHPALAREGQVALTLRLVCGLSTHDVARALLVAEPTMAARVTRAKRKIATARIPFRVPPRGELPARVDVVLDVVHLVFTTGHTAPRGASLQRRELSARALDLARLLRELLPESPGVGGLLALILLTDARRGARTDADGRIVRLAEQDRSRWDRTALDEGLALVGEALATTTRDRFVLMAAIAAVHGAAPSWGATDWRRIVTLYDDLVSVWPSPVVALNRAVAVGEADGPGAGLLALDELALEPQLARYHYLPAARAELLHRAGREGEARLALGEAIGLCENDVERAFLEGRLADEERPAEPQGPVRPSR